MDPIIFLLIIFILLLLSAFFAASETAITTVSDGKIHYLKQQGNKKAETISKLKQDKNSLISALLFGNNAVNIIASSIVTSFTIGYFGNDYVIYSTMIMTLTVIIFAEILPKTYAVHNALASSLFVANLLYIFFTFLKPFAKFMNVITSIFFKFSKSNIIKDESMVAQEEIRGTIDLYHHQGRVIKYDRDMLDNILEISNLEVLQIMNHRKDIFSVDIDGDINLTIQGMLDSSFSRIPIWQNNPDNIIAIMHIRDLIKALRIYGSNINSSHILEFAKKPWFIPDSTPIRKQLQEFRKQRQHFALVIDEYGDLVGFLTLEDILEEIVGEIDDEYDKIHDDIFKVSENNFLVNGHLHLRQLNKIMDWKIPSNDASTVAGFVVNEVGEIPKNGQTIQISEFEFKVVGKKNNQITKLLIRKLKK